jgi:sulfur-oxidizing protein SoxX
MKIKHKHVVAPAVVALLLAGTGIHAADGPDKLTMDVIKSSFRSQGQAKVEWLDQDAVQKACSAATPPATDAARKIEAEQFATVKWPADGKYLGDWKAGEKLAQSGRGMTWSDKPDAGSGGGCYNCHQISKEEISFGTIGPTLFNYGKLRGVADPAAAASEPVVKYTWAKIYNAKAYNACSTMPRMGHAGVLTEQQIKDAMALLLDPQSPVNK